METQTDGGICLIVIQDKLLTNSQVAGYFRRHVAHVMPHEWAYKWLNLYTVFKLNGNSMTNSGSLIVSMHICVEKNHAQESCLVVHHLRLPDNPLFMMTSSNGNISALLAICAGNSPVTGEFPAQRPVTRSFDVFLDLRLNKRLSKHSWGWWFETVSRPLWRHCNVVQRFVEVNNKETTQAVTRMISWVLWEWQL